MSVKVLVFLLSAFCLATGDDDYLPPYIKPCQLNNDLEKCARREIEEVLPHFVKGIPEYGVPSIDPVSLDDIKIDGNNLKLLFTEAKMFGLSTSKITDLKIQIQEEKFAMSFKCNITVAAKYIIDGQILILPIKGKGDAVVDARNIEVKITSKMSHVKDSKGDHFKLVGPNYSYDIEKTSFRFENLFNGNKELSEATHRFANENWRQLMDDLAPSAVKQIVKSTLKAINKFFSKVTVSQIITGA